MNKVSVNEVAECLELVFYTQAVYQRSKFGDQTTLVTENKIYFTVHMKNCISQSFAAFNGESIVVIFQVDISNFLSRKPPSATAQTNMETNGRLNGHDTTVSGFNVVAENRC